MTTDSVQNSLAVQHLDLQSYMLLYVPAVDWIMQCISYNASEVHTYTVDAVWILANLINMSLGVSTCSIDMVWILANLNNVTWGHYLKF